MFCGRLKTVAWEIVASSHSDLLEAKDFDGGNQLEVQKIIKCQVEKAFKDGAFLEDGVDNQVHSKSGTQY